MQIWIFFQSGVGGDGFANLLERSTNVKSVDEPIDYWRIHRIVDNQVKFYAPTIDQVGCFRHGSPFLATNNQLHQRYVDIVNSGQTCIVASHDIQLSLLQASDCQDILTKDQVKVLLVSKNPARTARQAIFKNLGTKLPPLSDVVKKYNAKNFDFVLDIDDMQSDWLKVNQFTLELGLDLEYYQYLQYQDIISGSTQYMVNNYNIECYQSEVNGDCISYRLVDIFNKT